ncbi:hypothetical protein MTX78_06765 [Hymenobacter tibetensis]|uniref:Uncharacterized protein n=1 Tax=Hymenobacter tibetensis TaxID=497967 RepID=A0ABY4D1N9_9BACT|nr:hypothetical protein [Hymenobacter tibetensis]UOG76295.1 hypothetical protein MTX78_06765 [Hymenobacter tibetensis]
MSDFMSYWGVLASMLTATSAAVLYFIKSWRDVEALKEHRRAQQTQITALLEKVDNYHIAALAREVKHKQAFEAKLQEARTDTAREAAAGRRESANAILRLNERVEALDKLLSVAVERQNQLLDSTRRQEVRNERVEKMLWRTNSRLNEE